MKVASSPSSVRAASEAGADADDERDRPARAVVVDRLEAGPHEGIHLRESGHVAKAELDVEVDSLCDGTRTRRSRRG